MKYDWTIIVSIYTSSFGKNKYVFSKGDPELSMTRNCRVHCINKHIRGTVVLQFLCLYLERDKWPNPWRLNLVSGNHRRMIHQMSSSRHRMSCQMSPCRRRTSFQIIPCRRQMYRQMIPCRLRMYRQMILCRRRMYRQMIPATFECTARWYRAAV